MTDKAEQVVNFNNHTLALNENKLKKILLRDEIKDRYVCVVSIAGSFRKGKSFTLNIFLRYLYAKYVHFNVSNWLGDENEPLTGFSWRSGPKRNTTGILMWKDVFLYDNPNGEKIAIILLDSQGIFDHQSTMEDCVSIFALAIMLSSVIIYNVSQNIQEDDLRNLQLFVEYGRMALRMTNQKPFQRLQFLVRDWQYPDEYQYGEEGGAKVISEYLKITDEQCEGLQSVRENIKSCFDEINCFLMPFPGRKVSSSSQFDGCLKDMDAEFKDNLKEFVPMLFEPKNLICKEINGDRISASMLVNCFKSYIAVFSGGSLPKPQNIMDVTTELFIDKTLNDFEEKHRECLEKIYLYEYSDMEDLSAKRARIKSELLEELKEKINFVNDALKIKTCNAFEKKIDQFFTDVLQKMGNKTEKQLKEILEKYRSDIESLSNQLKANDERIQELIMSLEKERNLNKKALEILTNMRNECDQLNKKLKEKKRRCVIL